MFRLLVVLVLCMSTAAAQPYRPVDLRRAERPARVEGGQDLPLPAALELAYQLRLDNRQLDRVISRAGASSDPTLIPTLWRLARAYAPVGDFSDQIFEALRRLGERDEAFIAEAERVGPTIPARPPGPQESRTFDQMFEAEAISGLQIYVGNLVQAAAARPDSSFLPRVVAVNRYTRGGSEGLYRSALAWKAQVFSLPVTEQIPLLARRADDAFVGTPATGAVQASHQFRGVIPFGPALYPDVVWSRERLATLYQQNPAVVTAGIDAYLARADLAVDAPDIRAYLLSAAAVPPPAPLPTVPLCAGRSATVYVANGRVVGGPLAGTLYAGRLVGTPGPDVIVGTDAADALLGLAGDDTLCGGPGDDALDAGPGADTADGGPGTDGCDAAETASACEGPVPALADVRPVLECVAGAPGGGFVAYFGVENKTTRAGRVAYGATNRITPAALDRAQPDLFGLPAVVAGRPGRTPFFPGHAFTVPFAAGQTVVWKLFSRTSTASASSPRCPAP